MLTQLAWLLTALPLSHAADTVLGVYMVCRHGDRTPKALPPTNLTYLGYEESYASGQYFRSKYVQAGATNRIAGINADVVKLAQLAASSPSDNVLQNSAAAFLQGLYPPVGNTTVAGEETLRNGSVISAPMNGFQLIPISIVTTGAASENTAWLQSSSSCNNALISSNNYLVSSVYNATLKSSAEIYSTVTPVVNSIFANSSINYKNAYTIWDVINVAEIHNKTIPANDTLTTTNLKYLQDLAFAHEWGLAYNASDNARAIQGMQIAAEIVQGLNSTITSSGALKFQVQFQAYATMLSFFGLAQLENVTNDFTGVPDYASCLSFELFTGAAATPFPNKTDLSVRFMFNNRTASTENAPVAYPLFGGNATSLTWTDFTTQMNKFAVGTTTQWCNICGNTDGYCAANTTSSSTSSSSGSNSSSSSSSHSGMSNAVAGVIGAMVTLAVILGSLALLFLLGGFRMVSKKHLGTASPTHSGSDTVKA